MTRLWLLAAVWVAWCTLHSLLIATPVTRFLQRRRGGAYRFYRLFFNGVSLVTVFGVLAFERALATPVLWHWEGAAVALRLALVVVAALLFAAGARRYDLLRFAGLRQLDERRTIQGMGAAGSGGGSGGSGLDTGGVLRLVRHPWYTGTLALIWTREPTAAAVIGNLILSAYLVIGARIEEAKLVREYGEEYRRYQRRVPMLLPLGGLLRRRGRQAGQAGRSWPRRPAETGKESE